MRRWPSNGTPNGVTTASWPVEAAFATSPLPERLLSGRARLLPGTSARFMVPQSLARHLRMYSVRDDAVGAAEIAHANAVQQHSPEAVTETTVR